MRPTLEAVIRALGALPLVVEEVSCAAEAVAVPSYPDEPRPSATVTLHGGGVAGAGEHVAWTGRDQREFAAAAPALAPRGRWRVADWTDAVAARTTGPYARAALEAAAIDLALQQAGTNLLALAGVPPAPVRYVVSFARTADPVGAAHRLGATAAELKIDVDPGWHDGVWRALGCLGVAVLDWKGAGIAADHERAHGALPRALLEDPGDGPWSAAVAGRVSFDACVRRAADVGALPVRPAAVNLKPARMGGVLEALRAATACAAAGIDVYLGGMFEVGVGRAQLHALAALLCPDAPNDVAPIPRVDPPPPWPPRLVVRADGVGFGLPPSQGAVARTRRTDGRRSTT